VPDPAARPVCRSLTVEGIFRFETINNDALVQLAYYLVLFLENKTMTSNEALADYSN
jgi:hypothetical protein